MNDKWLRGPTFNWQINLLHAMINRRGSEVNS
jgi:hypothetical protein